MLYAISTSTGGVAILSGSPELTIEEALATFRQTGPSISLQDIIQVKPEDLPPSRQFRDAWVIYEGRIVVDCDRSKHIQLANLIAIRDESLKSINNDIILAYIEGNTQRVQELQQEKLRLEGVAKNLEQLDTEGTVEDDFMLSAILMLGDLAQAKRRV